jgi:arylsulfatase A-like enzyme
MSAATPNVLFVTVDQWRAECLSRLGHPVVQTPNLDRIAARGVTFRNHFAQSAPCGPSRASLYTGLYAMNHRSVTNGTPLDARFTNIALEARALGYDPVLFGYTDTSVDPRTVEPDDPRLRTYEGVLPGFRAVCHLPEGQWNPWHDALVAAGYPIDPDGAWRAWVEEPEPGYPGTDKWGEHRAPTRYRAEHSNSAFLTDRLLEHLDAHTAGHGGSDTGPWFVHASYLRPHPPFFAPEPYNTMYDPDDVPMPVRAPTDAEETRTHSMLVPVMGIEWLSGPRDERKIRQLRATYYGMQTEVDAQLGRVLDWLDDHDQADDTIVILTSDHGEQLCDHYLMQKLGFFDQSYHVPLLVADPRTARDGGRGRVVESHTENVDVLPTLLDLLDAPIPLQCDGRSLRAWLEGDEPARWRDEAHWEWDLREPAHRMFEEQYGVTMEELSLAVLRDAHGKYVQFGGYPALESVFFDFDDDPDELHNRAGDPAYAPKVLDYAQRMLAWRLRHAERTLSGTKLTGIGVVEHRAERR